VKAVINLGVPQNSGKFLSGCTADGLLSSARLHVILCYLLIIIIIIIIIIMEAIIEHRGPDEMPRVVFGRHLLRIWSVTLTN
jgi:hypothetical protein